MVQLYFLSVLCNGLIGYILFARDIDEGDLAENSSCPLGLPVNTPTFLLGLSVLSIATGVLKLFSTMHGAPILGDLLPAAAGVIGGFCLLFGVYRQKTSNPVDSGSKLDRLGIALMGNRKILGILLLSAALLHFLFPDAFFL